MLKAQGLDKVFKQGAKKIHAVKSAGIEIEKAERIYIHGRSGAGKSTLLHLLGGLDKPTSGSVFFEDKDLYRFGDKRRSRIRNMHFGFVFQFYHLLPELTILENVSLPAMISGRSRLSKIKRKAADLLKVVGLEARLKHKPSQLSGGEIQRAAIARALVNGPKVLFCDEPTGNLDSKTSEGIYTLLGNISNKDQMSIVVVSHQNVDKDFFDTEYFMQDGVLQKEGQPALSAN